MRYLLSQVTDALTRSKQSVEAVNTSLEQRKIVLPRGYLFTVGEEGAWRTYLAETDVTFVLDGGIYPAHSKQYGLIAVQGIYTAYDDVGNASPSWFYPPPPFFLTKKPCTCVGFFLFVGERSAALGKKSG